jgi:hypothetical protein
MTASRTIETIGEWLACFGLSRLEATFRENCIDIDIMASLTDDDLRELGLTVGDRKRVLAAVSAPAACHPLSPVHIGAERRQLTVLFCDLAGSTALAAQLDPEDMREVIRAYQSACVDAVARHEGFVAQFMRLDVGQRENRAQMAIQALRRDGISFAITSGRPPRGMGMLIEPLALATPVAGFNGRIFVNPDMTVIEEHLLAPDTARRAVELIRGHGMDAWVYSGSEWLVHNPEAPHVAREQWTVKFPPTVVDDFGAAL